MSINKQFFLDPNGLDTLLEEIFSTISDHYIRQESIDSELDSTSTNPVQNSAITSALNDKIDRVVGQPGQVLMYNSNGEVIAGYMTIENEHLLDSIAVTVLPTKTTYELGEAFDPTGMVVTATYKRFNITYDGLSDFTLSPIANSTTSRIVTDYRCHPSTLNGETSVRIIYSDGDMCQDAVVPIITRIPIPTASTTSFTYTGSAITPTFTYNSTYVTEGGTYSATNADTYTATFTLKDTTNCVWSDGTTAPKSINWTINKISVAVPTASTTSFIYTGSAITPTFTYNSTYVTKGGTYSTTEAGTYTATFTLNDTTNYIWTDNTTAAKSISWSITVRTVSVPAINATTFTYSGTAVSPVFTYESNYVNRSGPTSATTSGTRSTTFALKSTTSCKWADNTTANKSLSWTVRELYGFQLNMDTSNPASMITYLGQTNYTAAKMNFSTGVFDYGSWAHAWFIRQLRPCILNYNGTVNCYLDPTNYAYTCTWSGDTYTRGAAATINSSCAGNVMVGIPTVYIKVDTSVSRKPKFYFSNVKIDSTYNAYAHTNSSGTIDSYIYMAAYEAWKDSSNRLRSISGQYPTGSLVADTAKTYARNNNPSGSTKWDMHLWVDRQLIALLLFLIGKSTNTKAVFGYGNYNGYNNKASGTSSSRGIHPGGAMNTKGLFWGSNANNLGVKVFGIEHMWGNAMLRTLGVVSSGNSTIAYKLTRGKQDGSTATDYNWLGTGYLQTGTCTESLGTYITDMHVGKFGLLPKVGASTGTTSTYYCDMFRYKPAFNGGGNGTGSILGGGSDTQSGVGIYYMHILYTPSSTHEGICTAISCKP